MLTNSAEDDGIPEVLVASNSAAGVVTVDDSVAEDCVGDGGDSVVASMSPNVEDSVGDVRDSITIDVWQIIPEKPSGQMQPSSPVLSSR